MFLFSLFVFVTAAGQYFSIVTGQINIMFSSGFCPNSFFCLRYTITKTCRLTGLHALSITKQIVHGTSGQMAAHGPVCHPHNSIRTSASLRAI